MKLTRLLIFILVFFANEAHAKLAISSWQESAQLTDDGKSSEIIIRGTVSELPQNTALSSFSISFDPRQHIKILHVINDNLLKDYSKSADYSFSNNVLNIKFPNGKKNGENIAIYFSYEEKYDKLNRFLRQEVIYVPAFAAGAKSTVTFNFPGHFESATFNQNLVKKGNSFIYSNIVPANGVQEIIKLTPSQSIWNVSVKTKITASTALGNFVVKVPTFFQSARQRVSNYNISYSATPLKQENKGDLTLLKFNIPAQEVTVGNNAKVITGIASRRTINRNAANYINFTSEESALLNPILQRIKSDPRYGNIPLYAKIGKFVNSYLRYDIRYLGKLPNLSEIIENQVGVCTEYARLFDALARVGGIPSLVIEGGACGEYQECQGHSWNMIYHEGQWLEVDPTWNLMSGIVSSSHVYFNDAGKGETGIEYYEKKENLKIKVDLEMENVS